MTYIRFLCVCVQFWAPCQSYVKLQLTKEVMLVSNTKFSSVIWYKGSAYTLHCHQKVCDFRRRICPLWVWRDLYVHANCTKGSLVTKPPWKRFDVNVIVWIFIIVAGICFLFVCVFEECGQRCVSLYTVQFRVWMTKWCCHYGPGTGRFVPCLFMLCKPQLALFLLRCSDVALCAFSAVFTMICFCFVSARSSILCNMLLCLCKSNSQQEEAE